MIKRTAIINDKCYSKNKNKKKIPLVLYLNSPPQYNKNNEIQSSQLVVKKFEKLRYNL